MKKHSQEELKKTLDDHKAWLEGKGGQRANLSYANLRSANLRSANPDEENEWDAVDRYAVCRDIAQAALSQEEKVTL